MLGGHNATVVADADTCAAFAAALPITGGYWTGAPGGSPPSADRLICSGTWFGVKVSI